MSVALIEKTKPEWQAGKLNGVGGKIEPGETSHQAMVREFKEETGVDALQWTPLISLRASDDATVHFFYATCEDAELQSLTEEKVAWYPVAELLSLRLSVSMIPNLRWLIPMAFDPDKPRGMLTNRP
jgi:8-oxo-dGTP diphosphatase